MTILHKLRCPHTSESYVNLGTSPSGHSSEAKCPLQIGRGLNPQSIAAQWSRQVPAVGSVFNRVVGAAESLIAKAATMGQRWLHGIGAAR